MGYNERKFGQDMLGDITEWIGKHLAPEEVFDQNGLLDYVRDNWTPDQVYNKEQLVRWARDNGYEKKED